MVGGLMQGGIFLFVTIAFHIIALCIGAATPLNSIDKSALTACQGVWGAVRAHLPVVLKTPVFHFHL